MNWVEPNQSGEKEITETELETEYSKTKLPKRTAGIDLEAGIIRLLGDEQLYLKLLKNFSHNYASAPQDMRKALEESNIDFVLRMAHTLKGVAGNLSAYKIQDIAIKLETDVLQNKFDKKEELLLALEEAFHTLKQWIETLEDDRDIKLSVQKEFKRSEVIPIVRKLTEMVWEDNFDAQNTLIELKSYMGDSICRNEIQALTECINEFDFEAAKRHLHKIAEELKINLEENENG